MNQAHKISLIIPARNENEALPHMLEGLPRDLTHEIIVVDGHSDDGTPVLARKSGCKVVTQEGRGYGMGVISGIKAAEGDLLCFMDADGSYDPEALPRLIELIDQGYDMAFCSRYLPGAGSDDDTFIRKLGNKFFTVLGRVMFKIELTDSLFFYALGKKEVFEALGLTARGFAICIEIPVKVHKAGYKYTEIPSRERPRFAGRSKVNAVWDGLLILATMIGLKLKGY